MNSHRFELYRAHSILVNSSNLVKFFWSWILKDSIRVQEKKTKVVLLSRTSSTNVHVVVVQWRRWMYKKAWCTSKAFVLPVCWFLPFSLLSSLSLLKPPVLYCLLGYWHLINNCANASESKKHCIFKPIQFLMEPSPTTSLPKEPHQSGFETILSPWVHMSPWMDLNEINLPLILDSVGTLKCF